MQYKKIANTLNMPREEWLKLRKGGIGGSDVGAIIGVNPWSSAFNVFIDKTTDYVKDLSDNDAVYWGTVLEDVVAKEFEKRTGKKVAKMNALLQSVETPFAYANIDRRIIGENAGLECKTTNTFNADEWKDGEVPASYICQCQWYMYVMGFKKWYIACLVGGQKFVWYELERDEEIISYMVERAAEFWNNHVLTGEAPPADGSANCTEYLKEAFPKDNGESVMFTSDYIALIDQLAEIKKQEKELKTQKTDIENRLKQYLGEAQTGMCEKYTVTWKTQNGAPKLDKERLVEDIGADKLAQYYTPTTVRRFSIKENK